MIQQINDGRDFQEYVLGFGPKVPPDNRYSGPPADGNVAAPQGQPANLDRYSVICLLLVVNLRVVQDDLLEHHNPLKPMSV